MTSARTIRWAAACAMVACVAALVFPVRAGAFDAMKSTNGFFINREATDSTASASITLYWGYKGGEQSWTTTYLPTYSGSYNYSETWSNLWQGDTDGIEVPLKPGYMLQQVRISQSGGLVRAFAVINEPLDVSVANTPTVDVRSQPAVSLVSSSVSIADTVTASIADIGGADATGLSVLGVTAFAVAAFYGGIAFSRSERVTWRA